MMVSKHGLMPQIAEPQPVPVKGHRPIRQRPQDKNGDGQPYPFGHSGHSGKIDVFRPKLRGLPPRRITAGIISHLLITFFPLGHCFPAPEWNRRSKYGMASRHKRVRAFRAVAKNYLLHIQGRRSNKSRFVEPAEIVVFHFQPDPSARRPVKHLRNA
jgi:hypothetical protein